MLDVSTWNETAKPADEAARQGTFLLARSVERRQREIEMASATGEPETVGIALIGRYIRRSRLLAEMTQQQLADAAGVSQSMVSRAERGIAPAMGAGRLVRLVQPLARLFPFGVCPHDHNCAWQPVKAPSDEVSDPSALIHYMLKIAGGT